VEIEYVTGDILRCDEEYIVQGCNAQGVMGSGLAKSIRDAYPKVYREYRKAYDKENFLELGSLIWVDVDDYIICNAITQQNFGRDPNTVYVSYDALQKVVQGIDEEVGDFDNPPRVAFPLIGCGLANGSWKIVSEIIEDFSTAFQPVVYLQDGIVPES
jgi:O-acetyl-ADP-ribose deacetylase (regulator of RNase III)